MPVLTSHAEHKAYDRAAELRQRIDQIGRLALECDGNDKLDLNPDPHIIVLSGADLTDTKGFRFLPAGLFPAADQAFSCVTGRVEIDPKSGHVAHLEVELGQDRFGNARYALETQGGWLGLSQPRQTLREELPSMTGSYARGSQSKLEVSADEWLFSQRRLTGSGSKQIF